MPMINMFNYFGGTKIYKRVWGWSSKAKAQEIAKLARSKGNLARIVKEADGWVVFVRKGR